jgi:formylglycine-generating enzyme required for sulfatase activity
MRTNYFDVESRYDNDAFADYPVIGVDWNQTHAYCAKARLGAGRPGPSSDTSHACPCS